jgi:hypothetical protein
VGIHIERICVQCQETFPATGAVFFCGDACRDTYAVRLALLDPETWSAEMGEDRGRLLHVKAFVVPGNVFDFDGELWLLVTVWTQGPKDTVGSFVPYDERAQEVIAAMARRSLL